MTMEYKKDLNKGKADSGKLTKYDKKRYGKRERERGKKDCHNLGAAGL